MDEVLFGKGATVLDGLVAVHKWLPAVLATPAVLTGSRAYGHPRPNSDTDLVVLVSEDTLEALKATADPKPETNEIDPLTRKHFVTEDYGQSYDRRGQSASLRFGRLNLIATTNPDLYAAWKKGTEELVSRAAMDKRTVERPEAVELIAKYLEEALQ